MSALLKRLSGCLNDLEAVGGYELSEGGQMCRAFIQRESLLTLSRDGQADALLQLTSTRDWASLKKLANKSSFQDIRLGAAKILSTYFPDGY